jgi:hypothetical protein
LTEWALKCKKAPAQGMRECCKMHMGIKQATSNGLKWSEVQVHLEIGPRLSEMGEIKKQRVHIHMKAIFRAES